ncbi:MAG: lipopolysaccharide kinase InaA family protein [Gammaproteobacteria bacterium]|nr:lipopolysaccharide kinase InaA family protein [Gammaproteobacteria bacterium]
MQLLDTRTLIASGRALPLPAVLQWQADGSAVTQTLELLSTFRVLPEKRVVALANWNGQLVVAKLFFARGRWTHHLERETRGIAVITEAGIATPDLLATGASVDEGTGVLLLKYIDSSNSVGQRWENSNATERDALLHKVVMLIARCHSKGLLQKDIHLDNFLLKGDDLYLLDAASVERHESGQDCAGVDSVRSLQNLALFFAQFPVNNDLSVQSLYEFYRTQRPGADISADTGMFAALLRQNRQARLKVVLDKLYRETSAHICIHHWDRFVVYRRELDSAAMREFIAAPDVAIAEARLLKKGNSSTVALVQIAGRHYVLKRYNIKSVWHGMSRALRPSRAWVSWRNAHMLQMLGVATPTPLLMLERRMGMLRREAYILCDHVPGEDALHFLGKEPINSPAWNRALEQFATLFQIMIEYGIVHGDMKATNFISNDSGLMVLDLDAMRQEHDKRHFLAAFRKDLQRFAANWQDQPEVAQRVSAMIGLIEKAL